MTLLSTKAWAGATLLPAGDGARLVHLEGDYAKSSLYWSTIGMGGELGAAQKLYEVADRGLDRPSILAEDDRYSLVWSELGLSLGGSLVFAEVDAAGATLTKATALDFGGKQPSSARIAATEAGRALVWLNQPRELQSELKFVRLDDSGKAVGQPRKLTEGGGSIAPQGFTKLGDGFLLSYTQIDYAAGVKATYVLALDATGEPRAPATKLDGGSGGSSILVRGERALVAWSVGDGGFEFSNRADAIRVAWFTAAGAIDGETYALQAPVIDEENVHPYWLDFGDDVGLFWSHGSIIYVCSGCFPDNHVKFVLLDGQDLTPKSALLDLPSPSMFGLLHPNAARDGDDVLVTADVTHHVYDEGASATLSCPRSP